MGWRSLASWSRGSRESPGHLNRLVREPGTRALRRFARAHGLRRIVVFGSATRGEFGPGSDIDLFVEMVTGQKPGVFGLSELTADAESLFGRDVDIVVGPVSDPLLRSAVDEEGVVLLGTG